MAEKENSDITDATRYLIEALEKSLYSPKYVEQAWHLKEFLRKLGIKSAKGNKLTYGSPLMIESLSSTFIGTTFKDSHLKLWNTKK